MTLRFLALGGAVSTLLFAAPAAFAQTAPAPAQFSQGEAVFGSRCKVCHEPAVERAPERSELATRKPAEVVAALTSGIMKPMASGLSDDDIAAVAAYLTTPGH